MNIRRAYHQYCGLAAAMDVLGERWTLLLVRELLLGPRRYSDLLADLPGLGTNLLAGRLKFLVDKGVIRTRCVGTGQRPAYELTELGHSLRPLVLELTRWGLGLAEPPSTMDTTRPRWAFLAVEAMAQSRGDLATDEDYEFRVDDEVFHLSVRAGRVIATHGPAATPAVVATAGAATLVGIGAGQVSPATAVLGGDLLVTGEGEAVARCCALLGVVLD